MKVIVIEDELLRSIDDLVNEAIKDIPRRRVLDIKFCCVFDSARGIRRYSAMIILK